MKEVGGSSGISSCVLTTAREIKAVDESLTHAIMSNALHYRADVARSLTDYCVTQNIPDSTVSDMMEAIHDYDPKDPLQIAAT